MANTYLASDEINVFPSTRRTYAQDFSARLMTESSIARIVNMLIDTEGFVITTTPSSSSAFEFNLGGYYFQVKTLSDLTGNYTSDTRIYATIFLDTSSSQFVELYTDSNETSGFTGVTFSSTDDVTPPAAISSSYKKYSILLLSRGSTSDSWSTPAASTSKFSLSSVGLSEIDGGIIN